MRYNLNHKIFSINKDEFPAVAMEVFRFQYTSNKVYRDYVNALNLNIEKIASLHEIPFMPISLFKSHIIQSTSFDPQAVFESSGSTQAISSRHYVKELSLYKESFNGAFEIFYGKPWEYCIIGLLPSYLERKNSSLTLMVDDLINASQNELSGFYLDEHEKLYGVLMELEKRQQQTILIGVSFGLLDFAERFQLNLKHTIVMETGGMKGRREELTREQVHHFLQQRLGVSDVHSEYGMTELLSQAYSKGDGIFYCPPWMKILLREEDDPLAVRPEQTSTGTSGIINIIDLANLYSCSFIAADDVGKLYPDGSFEVLGRVDNSDIRGCSLMVV